MKASGESFFQWSILKFTLLITFSASLLASLLTIIIRSLASIKNTTEIELIIFSSIFVIWILVMIYTSTKDFLERWGEAFTPEIDELILIENTKEKYMKLPIDLKINLNIHLLYFVMRI